MRIATIAATFLIAACSSSGSENSEPVVQQEDQSQQSEFMTGVEGRAMMQEAYNNGLIWSCRINNFDHNWKPQGSSARTNSLLIQADPSTDTITFYQAHTKAVRVSQRTYNETDSVRAAWGFGEFRYRFQHDRGGFFRLYRRDGFIFLDTFEGHKLSCGKVEYSLATISGTLLVERNFEYD